MSAKPGSVYPALRKDLKISRQSYGGEVSYVVKDPLKNQYFRFSKEEWEIISLFDGSKSPQEMIVAFNAAHRDKEIDEETLKSFHENLNSMNLLKKSTRDMNVMLVEKMRELRQSRILSTRGSLFYKRFPLVDPDRFFKRIVPKIGFLWTWESLILSFLVMLVGSGIILANWAEFKEGVYYLASFKHGSILQLLTLCLTIYVVIGIHELGHGLSCRHYGGEVHEIGFLLLFFQPCLYCNVNDAWILDKKWKQVVVTLAGGYVEYFIASLAAIGWALTSPLSYLNALFFQIMSIGSISTILFNFNPLIKLDGYYLLADFLGTPNLRERSFAWVRHLAATYLFRMKGTAPETTRRERIIFTVYGITAGLWTTATTLGLVVLLRNLSVQFLPQLTTIVTLLAIYKFFGAHFKKGLFFAVQWYLQKKAMLKDPVYRRRVILSAAAVAFAFAIPVPFSISGTCTLEPSFIRVIRPHTNGILRSFIKHDGEPVKPGDAIAQLENPVVENNLTLVTLEAQKLDLSVRDALLKESLQLSGLRRELAAKLSDRDHVARQAEDLALRYEHNEPGVLSCSDEARQLNRFFKKDEDLCRVIGISTLAVKIQSPETAIRFIKPGDPVRFNLLSTPGRSYSGTVSQIRPLPSGDPYNPKIKLFAIEMTIDNAVNQLRPGLRGIAKISTGWTPIGIHLYRKFLKIVDLDVFL
ncbi:MAG TPA: efflux RND transporter periplasmic adaptor subunit [Bdellovibrionota bacterium]|nr:efflux RND transporter periplasmic adaptor subunit [Bdellovibrionota bacterium]